MATATATPSRAQSRKASSDRTQTDAAKTAGQTPAAGKAQPKPRDESGTSTQTAGQAAAEKVDNLALTKLMVLSAANPKRANTIAHTFFEKYTGAQTVRDAVTAGVRGKDLSWDEARGHILVGEDVDAYQALQNDDERRAWITARFSRADSEVTPERVIKLAGLELPKEPETPPASTEGEAKS